ncbi:MAG: ribonuclease Y [Anaerolineae bacterium]|nr:ribonuclease Y [Anaerolineae bacterium]
MNVMLWVAWIAVTVAALLGGVAAGYWYCRYRARQRAITAQDEAERILETARAEAREIVLRARDEALAIRDEAEKEEQKARRELQAYDDRLRRRSESLDQKQEALEERSRRLDQRQSRLDKQASELSRLEEERQRELQRIANLTQEEARQIYLEQVAEGCRQDAARLIREIEAQAREEAEREARQIIGLAIQRCAADQVADSTVASVELPSDDMKGRIIGRGGRNIRAIESITGVDLVVDDTPEAVTISSFDPVRREIARLALQQLVQDGRIHPARIERLVEKAREEVEEQIEQAGQEAAYQVGIHGLHPELLKCLGRLRFRTSYGQNVLNHSVETALLAGMMAGELGADVQLAKLGGLLHDIGKATDHEVDGPHAAIGGDIARRFNMPPLVLNCILAHHGEEEPQCLEAILVEAADAISGARPGARREALETYIKRVRALEDLANSFKGVAQSYAIQAGREVRIVVKPEEVDDLAAIELAKDVARSVEENLQYPGQIKVTIIRETRAVDYAR